MEFRKREGQKNINTVPSSFNICSQHFTQHSSQLTLQAIKQSSNQAILSKPIIITRSPSTTNTSQSMNQSVHSTVVNTTMAMADAPRPSIQFSSHVDENRGRDTTAHPISESTDSTG